MVFSHLPLSDKNLPERTFSYQKVKILFLSITLGWALLVYLYNAYSPLTSLWQADSQGYVYFSTTRTVGYPIFLWIFHKLSGTYQVIPFFQLIIYSFATALLAARISNSCKSSIWGSLVLMPLLLNPELLKYHFQIMTESLSSSLLCLFLTSILTFFSEKRLKSLALATSWVGLGLLIRPINYSWLAGIMITLILVGPLWKRRLLPLLTAAGAPLLACILLGSTLYWGLHGSFRTQSFLGHNLIGKAALWSDPSIVSSTPSLVKSFSKEISPFRHALLKTKNIQNYYQIAGPFYDHIRYHIMPSLKEGPLTDHQMLTYSLEIIRARYLFFIRDALINLASLWVLLDLKTPRERKLLGQFLEEEKTFQQVPFIRDLFKVSHERPKILVYLVRFVFASLFITTLAVLGRTIISLKRTRYRSPNLLAAAVASSVIHAGFFITCILQAGLPRYAMSFWPCLYIFGVLLLKYLYDLFFRKGSRTYDF